MNVYARIAQTELDSLPQARGHLVTEPHIIIINKHTKMSDDDIKNR